MPRRRIGQEELFAAGDRRSSLDDLLTLIDWSEVAARLDVVHAAAKGKASWPPLAMFRALLLSVWYDLSDVKLADALDDRASFRRFCGFSRSEATPERTAFVRFRRALVAHGLGTALFEAVTAQLEAKAVRVKTGTIVDATVVASTSGEDGEAAWSGHRSRKAVHGYKAHVGADADTAIVEKIAITPGNRHDGRCGELALPEAPGEVYADSGYRGDAFATAVRARGGTPRVAVTAVWCRPHEDPAEKAGRLQWPDPAHPRPDREGLRNLEAQLRLQAHAMARSRQGRPPALPHRHRLQPPQNRQHHRRRMRQPATAADLKHTRRGTQAATR